MIFFSSFGHCQPCQKKHNFSFFLFLLDEMYVFLHSRSIMMKEEKTIEIGRINKKNIEV